MSFSGLGLYLHMVSKSGRVVNIDLIAPALHVTLWFVTHYHYLCTTTPTASVRHTYRIPPPSGVPWRSMYSVKKNCVRFELCGAGFRCPGVLLLWADVVVMICRVDLSCFHFTFIQKRRTPSVAEYLSCLTVLYLWGYFIHAITRDSYSCQVLLFNSRPRRVWSNYWFWREKSDPLEQGL